MPYRCYEEEEAACKIGTSDFLGYDHQTNPFHPDRRPIPSKHCHNICSRTNLQLARLSDASLRSVRYAIASIQTSVIVRESLTLRSIM